MLPMFIIGKKIALSSFPARNVFKRLHVAKNTPITEHEAKFLFFILLSPFFIKRKNTSETKKQKKKAIKINEFR